MPLRYSILILVMMALVSGCSDDDPVDVVDTGVDQPDAMMMPDADVTPNGPTPTAAVGREPIAG